MKKKKAEKTTSETRTSIHFDKCVEYLVAYNAAAFGLKNSVSAGIYLFSKLSADEQKNVIFEMKGIGPEISSLVDGIVSSFDSKSQERIQALLHPTSKSEKLA